jgi:hypothetical protein
VPDARECGQEDSLRAADLRSALEAELGRENVSDDGGIRDAHSGDWSEARKERPTQREPMRRDWPCAHRAQHLRPARVRDRAADFFRPVDGTGGEAGCSDRSMARTRLVSCHQQKLKAQYTRTPVDRFSIPGRFGQKELQALHWRGLRLHYRFCSSQRGEALARSRGNSKPHR